MTTMVNIDGPELESIVERLVTKKLQELLSQQSPETQMALMLQAHLQDFGEFRYEMRLKYKKAEDQLEQFRYEVRDKFEKVDARFDQVDARFKQVDDRFDRVEARLDRIENTMATKEDLNIQTAKVIDAVRRLFDQQKS